MHREILSAVAALHEAIDGQAGRLARRHTARLQCRLGCAGCCKDALTVLEVEAALIAERHPEVLTQAPHPDGACAFLDAAGACRVYESRPYVCRTQGLPLRWIEQALADDGVLEVFEYRDICPLNDAPPHNEPPLEILEAEDFWTIGPTEEKLLALQERHGAEKRVSLRSLFSRG